MKLTKRDKFSLLVTVQILLVLTLFNVVGLKNGIIVSILFVLYLYIESKISSLEENNNDKSTNRKQL